MNGKNTSPNCHVKEFCIEYLTRTEKVDYAIWLKGPWGCGKTFLYQEIKKTIMKEHQILEDDILYISLFGCSSIAEVQDKIFLNCLPFGENVAVKTIANIVGSVTFGIKGVLSIKPDDIYCGDLKESFGKKVFKRKIWVFDDIERSDISPIELLGFFYNILDNDNVKLLLIGDEDEYCKKFSSENYMQETIEKTLKPSENKSSSTTSQQSKSITNQKNKSLYHMMREKVVGYSIEVKPEKEVAIKKFVENVKHKIDIDDIEKKLNSLVKDLEISNLRVVKRSLESFVDFYEKIDKQYLDKVDYKETLLKIYMVMHMQYLTGYLYDENGKSYDSEIFYDALTIYNLSKKSYKNHSADLESLAFKSEKVSLPVKALWYELIIKLNNNSDFINSIIEEDYNKKFAIKEPSTNRDKVIYYYDNIDDDKFKDSLSLWAKDFQNGEFLTYHKIVEFLETVNYFAREEIISNEQEKEYKEIISIFTTEYKDKLLPLTDDKSETIPHFTEVPLEYFYKNIKTEVNKFCLDIKVKDFKKQIKDSLNTDEGYFFINTISAYPLDPKFRMLPIGNLIDNELLKTWVSKQKSRVQWNVFHFLKYRYDLSSVYREDDCKYLESIFTHYEKKYQEIEIYPSVEKNFYKKIMSAYKELLDYMDKHINPQPVETRN